MAKVKKAQKGFTLSEAKRKRDSLDYDARTRMAAARQRATGPKGYDDISRELSKRAAKSDSLKNVFNKAIEKTTKKAAPKQRSGGKMTKAKGGKQMMKRADGSVSQRGLWDNIRAAAKRNKAAGKPGKKPTAAMLKQERKIKAKGK
jgi:hypothetical protein